MESCEPGYDETADTPPPGSAFLLSQVGAHAAQRFAERIAELDLAPPQTGLLRAIAREPGQSQQALAQHLGTPPTRLVALVDGLEDRGVVQRRRNASDRRYYAVHLTDEGEQLMNEIARIAHEHDAAVTTCLDLAEKQQLRALLARIAEQQGLTAGVHPGYQRLAAEPSARKKRVRSEQNDRSSTRSSGAADGE